MAVAVAPARDHPIQLEEHLRLAWSQALALLDRQRIPLHCFRQGILERSFLPSEGIVFGRIPLLQTQTFLDPQRVLLLRREWFRGCIRLRCLAVRRRLPPARRPFWEGAYEDLLVPAYRGDPPVLEEMRRRLEEYDRLRREEVEDPGRSERLRHWCRAICLGVFSRLALDPWLGILPRPQGRTPDLAEDLALLMEPLFVDVPPPALDFVRTDARTAWRAEAPATPIRRVPIEGPVSAIGSPAARSQPRALGA